MIPLKADLEDLLLIPLAVIILGGIVVLYGGLLLNMIVWVSERPFFNLIKLIFGAATFIVVWLALLAACEMLK